MLKTLQWDTLQMRRQATRLTMLHKVNAGQVAIPAQKFLTPVVRPIRQNNSLAYLRPRAKKNCYKDSYFPRTIHEWNVLPEHIVNIPTTTTFKTQVTDHLRKQLQQA